MEHTINNLNAAAENLDAAGSRIKDVDMALEMATFTQYQILQQAGTAMLAQANMSPRQYSSCWVNKQESIIKENLRGFAPQVSFPMFVHLCL